MAQGIEINPYAAELARVTVWIGEIQWMRIYPEFPSWSAFYMLDATILHAE